MKITINLADELHKKLTDEAAIDDQKDLSAIVSAALSEYFNVREREKNELVIKKRRSIAKKLISTIKPQSLAEKPTHKPKG